MLKERTTGDGKDYDTTVHHHCQGSPGLVRHCENTDQAYATLQDNKVIGCWFSYYTSS